MSGEWFVVPRDDRETLRTNGGRAQWALKHTSTTEEHGRFSSFEEAEIEAGARNARGDRPAKATDR